MYIFRKERDTNNRFDIANVEFRIEAGCSLPELLEEFACFLRGCGFVIAGELQVEEVDAEVDPDARGYITLARVRTSVQAALVSVNETFLVRADFINALHDELNRPAVD